MTIVDKSDDQAVFGPVPSRRLGMSLGVDLLWPKTCSLDCVYCECGATTMHTDQRQRFRDPDDVLRQVRQRLDELETPPDYLTLAGSGEPTLHSDMGYILRKLREMDAGKTAVLTNGTLVHDPAVRDELCLADVVIPSLDAVSEDIFRKINRPCKGLSAAAMIDGLIKLRAQFNGRLVLEILLVAGVNDTDAEVAKLVTAAGDIAPDLVQINTVVRPPAVEGFQAVDPARLAEIAALFTVPTEVIAGPQAKTGGDHGSLERQVVEMTRRRPCTAEDITAMTGLESEAAARFIADLEERGKLVREPVGQVMFYRGV